MLLVSADFISPTRMTTPTPQILERARLLVEPSLRHAVEQLDPQIAPLALYHFGWADEHGQPATAGSGGKGIRSALAVLSAEAASAPAEAGVPGAVAVELIHNFSLLHDDIIDGDAERRHRPTVWAVFSQGEAIIVGDALHALAFDVLLGGSAGGMGSAVGRTAAGGVGSAAGATTEGGAGSAAGRTTAGGTAAGGAAVEANDVATEASGQYSPHSTGDFSLVETNDVAREASGAAASRLASATAAMIAGQSRDMAFNERMDVTPEQCLAMEADKTGALLGYASSVGAVLAGADAEIVTTLESYGSKLGLAFQAADDLLGIWGDPAVTGKPVGNDLRERKKSFPVVVALSQQTAASEELASILSQDAALNESAIARATELVEQAGGKESATAAAHDYLHQALACIQTAPLAAPAVEELTHLARFVVARDH